MPVLTPAQINIYSVTSTNSPWGTAPVGNPSVLDVNACLFAGNIPLSTTIVGSPAAEGLNVYVLNPLSVAFPSNLPVTQDTSPWVVSGTVAFSNTSIQVSNFPATQAVTQSGVWNITSIANPVAVTGTFWQATQPVSGSVSVSNFPAAVPFTFTNYGSPAVEAANVYVVNPLSVTFTESTIGVTQNTSPWVVSGTVSVSNFPASQAVTGTFWQAVQPVSFTTPFSIDLNDGFGNAINSSSYGSPAVNALDVYVVNSTSSSVTQGTSPWITADEHITKNLNQDSGGNVGVNIENTVPVSNAALSEMMFTSYGSPPCTALSVYVVNPLTVTFTESTIGVTQSTSPWVVSGSVSVSNFPATQPVSNATLSEMSFTNYGGSSPAVEGLNVYVLNPVSTTAATTSATAAAWTSATSVNTALQVNTAGYSTVVFTLNQGSTITGGIVTFEASDTTAFTNAYPIVAQPANNPGSAPVTTYTFIASTNASYTVNCAGRAAVRVRLSTGILGTGTVNVGATASAGSTFPLNVGVTTTVNCNLENLHTTNAAAAAATSLLGVMPAVANAVAPAYTETYNVLLSTDLSGNLRTIDGRETFTNYGSPPVEALNTYVVNPLTVTFTESTLAVTNAGTFPVQAQDVSAGNASTSQVSITSTATSIVVARATRNSVKITNMGTTPIYLGFTSGVTVSTGDFLPGILGAFVVYPTQTGVWGIVATGSSPPSEVVAVADVWN